MKSIILLSFLFVAGTMFADPIRITVECSGVPVREAARATFVPSPIKLVAANDAIEPLQMSIPDGHTGVFELIREFKYAKKLEFPKEAGAAIQPKDLETSNTGITVEITATREGDQIIFQGRCIIRGPASIMIAQRATPKTEATVSSTNFITREATFAGRAPLGVPAKIDLGEQGVDTGELTLTFANGK